MGGSGLSAPFWGVCVHCWAVALLRAAVGTQECTQIGENKTFGWFSYGLCTLSSRWAHRAGVRRSEQPLSPLCDDRDGHAALRGAPAPPVPCHVAAGEVGGSMLALELAVPVRASENAAALIPGRLRGAMARPERLRRAVGRGRGGRPLPRRTRQDEGARAGAVRGTRPMLTAAGRTSGRHGRRSRASQAARAKRSARSVRMAAVLVPVLGFDKHCAARLPTCRCAPSPPQGRQPPSPRDASCPASRRGCAPAGMPGDRDPGSTPPMMAVCAARRPRKSGAAGHARPSPAPREAAPPPQRPNSSRPTRRRRASSAGS